MSSWSLEIKLLRMIIISICIKFNFLICLGKMVGKYDDSHMHSFQTHYKTWSSFDFLTVWLRWVRPRALLVCGLEATNKDGSLYFWMDHCLKLRCQSKTILKTAYNGTTYWDNVY
jgi:hypothetical protein